jgi:hypothetical protein
MKETSVKPEVLATHFRNYFPSLRNYPDKYLVLFNIEIDKQPAHLAYLCPLCLNKGIIVTNEHGLGMHCEFSLDHYPPQSVGGFETLLVCTKCNSDAGSEYDFSLKQKIKDIAFGKRMPFASMRSKSQITNVIGRYPSMFSVGENGEVEISLKPNEKIHAPFLDDFIEYSKTNRDYKIEMTIHVADEGKVCKALLKAAYLHCFDLWGYEFVFSNAGEMMRKVLNSEAEYPVRMPTFYLGDLFKDTENLKLPKGICYLKFPVEWRCFIVNMAMKDEETGFTEIVAVMIPGPSKENWNDLNRIQEIISKNPIQNITMNHVTEYNITNSNNGYTKSWEILIKDPCADLELSPN